MLRLRCGLKLEDDEAVLRERNWGGVNNNEVVVNGQSQDAELISRLGQHQSRGHLPHFFHRITVLQLEKTYLFNNKFLMEIGMASTPKMEYVPCFSLHFPKELSNGYLRLAGNGKIPLGR